METEGLSPARPRGSSASARFRMRAISSRERGCRTATRQRESKAALTSNEGFSVVAPMSVIVPCSTACKSASCWALLKRWISSMKRMTRPPRRRTLAASSIAARTSLTPERTAERAMSRASLARAIRRANVVLPVPGGPQSINEGSFPWGRSARVRSDSLPTSPAWPTNSFKVRGRIRSARGESEAGGSASSSGRSNRLIVSFLAMANLELVFGRIW